MKIDIKHLAKLSNLRFEESEAKKLEKEMGDIIGMVEKMPDIPYVLFHCTADLAVNIESHSERFVDAMRQNGKNIEFIKVDGRGHCDLTAESALAYFNALCTPFN